LLKCGFDVIKLERYCCVWDFDVFFCFGFERPIFGYEFSLYPIFLKSPRQNGRVLTCPFYLFKGGIGGIKADKTGSALTFRERLFLGDFRCIRQVAIFVVRGFLCFGLLFLNKA